MATREQLEKAKERKRAYAARRGLALEQPMTPEQKRTYERERKRAYRARMRQANPAGPRDSGGHCRYNTVRVRPEQRAALFEAQGGCCAVCGRPETEFKRRLGVNWCPTTNRVRGLLCASCHAIVSLAGTDPQDRLQKVSIFLMSH